MFIGRGGADRDVLWIWMVVSGQRKKNEQKRKKEQLDTHTAQAPTSISFESLRAIRMKANVLGYFLNQHGLFAGVVRTPQDGRINTFFSGLI